MLPLAAFGVTQQESDQARKNIKCARYLALDKYAGHSCKKGHRCDGLFWSD
jgi:hypothetical protein